MTDRADDRLHTGVLILLPLVALTVGGWWWVANAPATGPVRPTVPASPSPDSLDRPLVGVDPDTAVTFHVDPDTGLVVGEPDAADVVAGPDEPDAGDVEEGPVVDDPADGLARFAETVWRERVTLVVGQPGVTRRAAIEDGERHLLQYRCSGPGELRVRLTRSSGTETGQVDCDNTATTVELVGEGGQVDVTLSPAGYEPVDVEAQLVALP